MAWLVPLTGWTQPSVSVTATVLHDHFAGQLSSTVRAWVDQEVTQLGGNGQYNASALTLDLQSRFAGQAVGTPEAQALALVILVEATKGAEFTMTNSEAQLAAMESARVAAERAKIITHPMTISQGTNQPALDIRREPRLYHDYIQSQATFNRLAETLKYYQSQATELANAHLSGLK